ncbi:MAG TPA: pyridoxal phosphate-dependent aminotransferase [Candidatus Sulfotelmatobacter sp.]
MSQNLFTQAVEAARARGRKLFDLTISNPTRVGLQYNSSAIIEAFSSARILDYDPQAKGLLQARQTVAAYYREQGTPSTDPENIVLTTSTSEGYSFVFRLLCNPGDEILVPKPSYPLFEFLADLQDVKLVPYPLIYDHGWQIDLHSLESAASARTRGIVLVHPNNPTGSYVKAHEVQILNSICERRNLALIVDEVFLDYKLDAAETSASRSPVEQRSTAQGGLSARPDAYGTFAQNQGVLTFTLSGLSKISALPQMKAAWIVTAGPHAPVAAAMERLDVIADTYLSMNAPVQWALPTLLEGKTRVQEQLLRRVETNLRELDRQLSSQKTCERFIVEGGWYAVLRVPVICSDEELAVALVREHSVLVHPGHFYDFPNDGYLILSLIGNPTEFQQGVSCVLDHFKA